MAGELILIIEVKNGMNEQILSSWTLAQTTTVAPQVAANIEQQVKTAAVCYSLDLETGGKAYMLAGGMDETTAYGLMRDVSKILGFSEGKGG